MSPNHYQTIFEVAKLLESGELSALSLTEAMLARIDQLDGQLHSYATLMAEKALKDAAQADVEIASGQYRSPLHGVPIAVKDLCYTKGVRTMGGTKVLADFVPDFDATVVRRLQAAGAIILGKLNLTEGAMAGYHRDFPIPLNPWDRSKWTGVSSSGSGAATAAGLAYATLGSDTGGSIRFPAAACGIVGLKPTWGRVSRYGVLDLAESLDHVGPMARSVADAALVFQTIAGYDRDDPTSLSAPVPDLVASLGRGINGLRLGVDEQYIRDDCDPEVAEAVLAAIALLEKLGARLVSVKMPDLTAMLPGWFTLTAAEAVVAHKATYPARRDDYGLYFGEMLDFGASLTAADYVEVNHLRQICNAQIKVVFDDIDALACPSTPFQPWVVDPERLYGPIGTRNPIRQKYTVPFDFNGAPTLSLPCGFDEAGMPISLQLVGSLLGEELICRLGHAYEQATEWHQQHPNVSF